MARICHVFFCAGASAGLAALAWAPLAAQFPPYERAAAIERREVPPEGVVVVRAAQQEREGSRYRLRGRAEIETAEMLLRADEIDYDQETGVAEARGHVHFINFTSGEQLWAERIDYSTKDAGGTFYRVRGAAYGKNRLPAGHPPDGKSVFLPGRLGGENPAAIHSCTRRRSRIAAA